MNPIIAYILQAILIAAVLAVSTCLCRLLAAQKKKIDDADKTGEAYELYSTALECVQTAVAKVAQTYVDGLKKSETFNLENQRIAFDMAKQAALDLIPTDAIQYLRENYELDAWLEGKIEEAVRGLKGQD